MNVEMNVSVVDLSANQKKLQVQIPALRVQDELDRRYRDLAKSIRIKGFRPGKVPRHIIKSYYGKTIENELSSQFIHESYQDALGEASLKPLVEADVSEMRFEDDGTFTYSALVDVAPPFQLEDYKGLAIQRTAIDVTEEQFEAELERIRQQHAQLRTIEGARPVAEGDVVLVDILPTVDGSIFEKGKQHDYMLEIGKQTLHPEFDQHLIGHDAGAAVAFELDFPADTPTPEIAGKRVHFEVTIREIKEKVVPELNDDFAKEVGQFEGVDNLKQTVREMLHKRETEKASAAVREQMIEQLLEKVSIELSSKVIEREVDRLVDLFRQQFESQGLKIDFGKLDTPEIRASYRPQAERNVRWRIIYGYIAELEQLALTDEETAEIYRDVARMARMDVETVKRDYADNFMVQQAKERKLQDKVLTLLEDAAVSSQAAPDQPTPDQE